MLHDTTRRPRTLHDWTQGLPVHTKVPHQRSRLLQPCRYTPHSSLTVLLLPKRVSPRSGLGSIVTPNTKPSKVKKSNQTREAIHDELILRYTPLTSPQQSRQFCDTVAELDCFRKMLVCILRLCLQNVAVRKSRHRLLFSPTRKGQKHNKIPFQDVSRFGR